MSVIAFDGLTKHFRNVVAVDDLTVRLAPGRVVGLLGPNGAGKTTTLRMLLGLVAPTAGSATIDGQPYRDLDEPIRHIGAVLEASSFHPGRRAREHLRVLAATAGLPDDRVDEVLADVALTGVARRRVGGFSLGMRQRLGLAAALLGEPEILVLDEPTNGLDPEGVRWLRDFVRGYAAAGRTVLVSSHLLAEVAQTVDEVVVLVAGRLVAHAPLAELHVAPARWCASAPRRPPRCAPPSTSTASSPSWQAPTSCSPTVPRPRPSGGPSPPPASSPTRSTRSTPTWSTPSST